MFSYLPVKVGDTMTDERAAAAIHALFATGFFKDVKFKVDHGVLIVQVLERPSIASIEINGVKDFPKDQLKDSHEICGTGRSAHFRQGRAGQGDAGTETRSMSRAANTPSR